MKKMPPGLKFGWAKAADPLRAIAGVMRQHTDTVHPIPIRRAFMTNLPLHEQADPAQATPPGRPEHPTILILLCARTPVIGL
jgi:hypothetical protein